MYSGAQKKVYEYCFVKQKYQIQMSIVQYENAALPLRTEGINTIYQQFQMSYKYKFVLAPEAQKLSAIKF